MRHDCRRTGTSSRRSHRQPRRIAFPNCESSERASIFLSCRHGERGGASTGCGRGPPQGRGFSCEGLQRARLLGSHRPRIGVESPTLYPLCDIHVREPCEWTTMHGGHNSHATQRRHPNNAPLFRDIMAVENRKVLSSTNGLKVIQVDQIGELKIMW